MKAYLLFIFVFVVGCSSGTIPSSKAPAKKPIVETPDAEDLVERPEDVRTLPLTPPDQLFTGESFDAGIIYLTESIEWTDHRVLKHPYVIKDSAVLKIKAGAKVTFQTGSFIQVGTPQCQGLNERAQIIIEGQPNKPVTFEIGKEEGFYSKSQQSLLDIFCKESSIQNLRIKSAGEDLANLWPHLINLRPEAHLSYLQNLNIDSEDFSLSLQGAIEIFEGFATTKSSLEKASIIISPKALVGLQGSIYELKQESESAAAESIKFQLLSEPISSDRRVHLKGEGRTQYIYSSFGAMEAWTFSKVRQVEHVEIDPHVTIQLAPNEAIHFGRNDFSAEGRPGQEIVFTALDDTSFWYGFIADGDLENSVSLQHIKIMRAQTGLRMSEDHTKIFNHLSSVNTEDSCGAACFVSIPHMTDNDEEVLDGSNFQNLWLTKEELKNDEVERLEVVDAYSDITWEFLQSETAPRDYLVLENTRYESVWGRAANSLIDAIVSNKLEIDEKYKDVEKEEALRRILASFRASNLSRQRLEILAAFQKVRFDKQRGLDLNLFIKLISDLRSDSERETFASVLSLQTKDSLGSLLSYLVSNSYLGVSLKAKKDFKTESNQNLYILRNYKAEEQTQALHLFAKVASKMSGSSESLFEIIDEASRELAGIAEINDRYERISLRKNYAARIISQMGEAGVDQAIIVASSLVSENGGSIQVLNRLYDLKKEGKSWPEIAEELPYIISTRRGGLSMLAMSETYPTYHRDTVIQAFAILGGVIQHSQNQRVRVRAYSYLIKLIKGESFEVGGQQLNQRGELPLMIYAMEVLAKVGPIEGMKAYVAQAEQAIHAHCYKAHPFYKKSIYPDLNHRLPYTAAKTYYRMIRGEDFRKSF